MNKSQIRIFYRSRARSFFKGPSSWSEHHLNILKIYNTIELKI